MRHNIDPGLNWAEIDNLNKFPAVWRHQISNFSEGACPRTSLKPLQSVQLSQLREIVPILLQNPQSRLDFSRDTASIPILKIGSHKPTNIYF